MSQNVSLSYDYFKSEDHLIQQFSVFRESLFLNYDINNNFIEEIIFLKYTMVLQNRTFDTNKKN